MGQGFGRGVMKKEFLEAGEFVSTHGIGGELRLYPWCDSPEFLAGFAQLYLSAAGGKPVQVEAVRPHKTLCIVKLAGVHSIEEARPYIGKTVYISRAEAALPEGHYFVQDILGARVVDADTGREYGHIEEVSHPGRHDVWQVQDENGEHYLFPAVEPFLVKLDVAGELALVRPIEGMFEAAPPPKAKGKKTKKDGL